MCVADRVFDEWNRKAGGGIPAKPDAPMRLDGTGFLSVPSASRGPRRSEQEVSDIQIAGDRSINHHRRPHAAAAGRRRRFITNTRRCVFPRLARQPCGVLYIRFSTRVFIASEIVGSSLLLYHPV